MALKKKAKVKGAVVVHDAEATDPFYDYYSSQLDELEKTYKLTGGLAVTDRLSTGVLVVDLILSGGVGAGGMISFAGPEASSKTTLATTVLGSVIANKMIANFHDPEGSLDGTYSGNILKVGRLEEVFGRKSETGAWIIKPKARYWDDNTLETFFNFERDFLMRLPDKKYIPENDTWYYVFPASRDGIKERLANMGLRSDKELYRETGKYWCPTEKRGAQAAIFCDSWPSLLSEDQDVEGKERSKRMAFNASKFSEYLPQVVGKLRRKAVNLFGVNQIRLNPGGYGNPMYEPCGTALKFYSSCRLQLFAKTVPHKKTDPLEKEPSAFGEGDDVYAYKYIKNTKNKQGTPFLDGWVRVWVRDSEGQGRGYCPVWDTYQYLLSTGRIDGKRNKFRIKMKGFETSKPVTWLDFKRLILAEDMAQKKKAIALAGWSKWLDLRAACFAELKSGEGMKLYNENAAKSKKSLEDLEE